MFITVMSCNGWYRTAQRTVAISLILRLKITKLRIAMEQPTLQDYFWGVELVGLDWWGESKELEDHIQKKVIELAQSEFIASRGWLQNFFQRYRLSLRRKTLVSQKLLQDLLSKVLCHGMTLHLLYVAFLLT